VSAGRWIAIAGAIGVLASQAVLLMRGEDRAGVAVAILFGLIVLGTMLAREAAAAKAALVGGGVLLVGAAAQVYVAVRLAQSPVLPAVFLVSGLAVLLGGMVLRRAR
jgi:hypothetical protein